MFIWAVNKPCYNDSLCLNEYSKMICLKRKRHLFRAGFYFSAESTFQEIVSKQNFYACARAKRSMSPRHSAYILSSVKSPQATDKSLSKLSKFYIRTNSPHWNVLLWTSFCFLKVNQQKPVGFVSTNNM